MVAVLRLADTTNVIILRTYSGDIDRQTHYYYDEGDDDDVSIDSTAAVAARERKKFTSNAWAGLEIFSEKHFDDTDIRGCCPKTFADPGESVYAAKPKEIATAAIIT